MSSSFDRRALLARLVAIAAMPLVPATPWRSGRGRMMVRGERGAGALNRAGAIIWLGLVRGLPEQQIAKAIAAESGDSVDDALATVRRFARELVEKGILDD